MQLRCPECSTAYRVDDDLITGTSPTFRCSRCQHVFVVEVRSATHDEQVGDAVIDTGPSRENAENLEKPAALAKDSGHGATSNAEESRGLRGDAQSDGAKVDPDEDFFIFPKDENEHDFGQTRTGGQMSVLPFVSLFGILLFVFALVAMTYQIDPAPLESVIRRIPWYGSTIFESRHFKRGLELKSLTSGLQPVLGQQEVLIVSGTLVNRNTRGMQAIQIEAQIYDAEGKPLGKQSIYLGNALSPKIIQDMTPREISLLQSLKPQNIYRIEPNESVTFTVVLPKPKKGVSAFSCRVVSAEATA